LQRCWRESNHRLELLRELRRGSCEPWKPDRTASRSAIAPATQRYFSPRRSRSSKSAAAQRQFAPAKVVAQSSALPERATSFRRCLEQQRREDVAARSALHQPPTAEPEHRALGPQTIPRCSHRTRSFSARPVARCLQSPTEMLELAASASPRIQKRLQRQRTASRRRVSAKRARVLVKRVLQNAIEASHCSVRASHGSAPTSRCASRARCCIAASRREHSRRCEEKSAS